MMDVEEKKIKQIDIYNPRLITANWKPLHKVILKNYESDKNLFFTYFNNSHEELFINETWTENEKQSLIEILYRLYKSKISQTKGIWGIISLKFNRKNGLICYQYYTQLRSEILIKKQIEKFKEIFQNIQRIQTFDSSMNNKSELFEKEFENFKLFFVSELNQLSVKLNQNQIDEVCKIINVNYFDISCRVKVRVDDLVQWLDNDKEFCSARKFELILQKKFMNFFFQSKAILKKDPIKNINNIDTCQYIIKKSLNQSMNNEEDIHIQNISKLNKLTNADQEEREQRTSMRSEKKQKQLETQMNEEPIQNNEGKQRNNKPSTQSKSLKNSTQKENTTQIVQKRRTRMDFELIKPIFDGEYESEPELSFTCQKKEIDQLNVTCPIINILNNNYQTAQQNTIQPNVSIISFSTNDNISQLSFWSLKDPQINRNINEIDDKYDFEFEDNGNDENNQNENNNQGNSEFRNGQIFKQSIGDSNLDQEISQFQGNPCSQYSFFEENSVNPFEFEDNIQRKKKSLYKKEEKQDNIEFSNLTQSVINNDNNETKKQGLINKNNKFNLNDSLKKVKLQQSKKNNNEGKKEQVKIPKKRTLLSRKEKKTKVQQFKEKLLEEQDINYKYYKETRQKKKVEQAFKEFKQENKKRNTIQKQDQASNIRRLKSKKLLNENRNIKNNPIKQRNIITQNQLIKKYQNNKNNEKESKKVYFDLQSDEIDKQLDIQQSKLYEKYNNNNNNTVQDSYYEENSNNFTKTKNNYSNLQDEYITNQLQEDIENFDNNLSNIISGRRLIKNNNQTNSSIINDKSKGSQLFKVQKNFYSKDGLSDLQQQITTDNMNEFKYQKTYRQQTLQEGFGFQNMQQNLIKAIKNEKQLIYYKIEDVENKRDQTQENLGKNQAIPINNSILQQAISCLKEENFNVTYFCNQIGSINILLESFLSNQLTEELNPSLVNQFFQESIAILRNQYFWDRIDKKNKNNLIYLLYLFSVALRNDEFKEYYHEFIYKNYIMSSYKFIGITLFNVCLNLMNGSSLEAESDNKNNMINQMDIEQNTIISEEDQEKSKFYKESFQQSFSHKKTSKLNKTFVNQSIHEREQDTLEELSNQIIVFSEMLKYLTKKQNQVNFERQLKLFATGAELVQELFKMCQSEELIAERFFQQYPNDICCLNCDNLDVSLVLLYYLFYAGDVSQTKKDREQFITNLKKILANQSQSKITTSIFDESAIHYFSIFQDIFSEKDKVIILINLIDSHKDIEKLENFFSNSTFVNGIDITPDLISKISTIIQSKLQSQNNVSNGSKNIVTTSISNSNGIFNENYIEIFREIEVDEDRREEENEESKSQLSVNETSNDKKQEGKLSSEAYLIKLPSDLLSKYFVENKSTMSIKDQKRFYSQIQSIISPQKDKQNTNYLVLLKDILILKVLIKNLDFSDPSILQNIIKKCKSIIENPKENVFIARTLLRNIYSCFTKTVENSLFINSQTEKIYNDIFETTYSILEFLIDKYVSLVKNASAQNNQQLKHKAINTSINKDNISPSIQKDIQSYRLSIKQSINHAFKLTNQMLLKSDDYINLFISHFLKTQKLFTLIDPKVEIDIELRKIIFQMFYNLYSYPKTIATNFILNESTNIYSNNISNKSNFNLSNQNGNGNSSTKTSAQKNTTNNIQKTDFQQSSHLSTQNNQKLNQPILSQINDTNTSHYNPFDNNNDSDGSSSDDGEFIAMATRKNERYKRLIKIQNSLIDINEKVKQHVLEFINAIFNKDAMHKINREYHPNINLFASIFRLLGNIMNFDFHQKQESVFELISSLLLYDKMFFIGSNQIEKTIYQMMTVFFIQLINSFEGSSVQMICEYEQNFRLFSDRILLSQNIEQYGLQKIKVFSQLLIKDENDQAESELDIIKFTIKNIKRQLQADNDRYLERFILYGLFDQLKMCLRDILFNEQENKHSIKLYKRVIYFLQKIQFTPQEIQQESFVNFSIQENNKKPSSVNQKSNQIQQQNSSILFDSINNIWNFIFSKDINQSSDMTSFELKDPIILKRLLQEDNFDFKLILKYCIKAEYKDFIQKLCIHLKSIDILRILSMYKQNESRSIEGLCANLLIDTLQSQLEGVLSQDFKTSEKKKPFRIKYLRVFLLNIQEMKCKYFFKDNIQKNSIVNTFQNNVVRTLMEVKLSDDDNQRKNAILSDNKKQQQLMMSTFIYILLTIDQINFLMQLDEYSSSLQLKEIEQLIESLLNDIVLRESFNSIFSSQSSENIQQIQILVMRRILLLIKSFDKTDQLNSDFIAKLNQCYWKYLLQKTLNIAQYFDPDILMKFEQGQQSIYLQIWHQFQCNFNKDSLLSSTQFFVIFNSLKQLAKDIDSTFSLLIDMNGYSCSQFISEILNQLNENLRSQNQNNTNFKLQELQSFLDKVSENSQNIYSQIPYLSYQN